MEKYGFVIKIMTKKSFFLSVRPGVKRLVWSLKVLQDVRDIKMSDVKKNNRFGNQISLILKSEKCLFTVLYICLLTSLDCYLEK